MDEKPEPVIPVKIYTVRSQPTIEMQNYIGTVEESQSIPLSFLTGGTIENVLADEGDIVHKGQLLAVLNSVSYQNAAQAAIAKEKQADDAYMRLSEVYKNGSLPEVKMIEIETGLEQARSASRIAVKNLEDCKLYSPVSGVIGRRSVEPGMNVVPGSPVFTIVKIDRVKIVVSVPEKEISSIKKGQQSVIIVPALSNQEFNGKVEQKGVLANPVSHTYKVNIMVDNKDDHLRPGMVCNVFSGNHDVQYTMTVPQQAIMISNTGSKFVFVVDTASSRAYHRDITTGSFSSNGDITVTSGLKEGDHVVTDGYHMLQDHTLIQIKQ
jgi:RND family efflux transporter MFP subunit